MPKDWDSHKAELRRLYIDENMKLLDIQQILEHRGFKASIRAYRTRLELWEFRKYNSKNGRIKTIKRRETPSLFRTSSSEKESGDLFLGDHYMGPAPENELTANSSDSTEVPTVCVVHNTPGHGGFLYDFHGPFLYDFDDVPMIFVGDFQVPKQAAPPEILLSYIPHSSGLQLYGLLATWPDEGEDDSQWINHLKYMLRDEESRYMILEPQRDIQIGEDFVAANYFNAISHSVASLPCQIKVKKLILLAVQEQDTLMPRSPPWVIAWWKASNTCQWSFALYLLRHSMVESNMRDFFTGTGKVMIGNRLLHHHYEILVKHVKCLRPECAYRNVDSMQDLMKEYVEIIQDIAGIQSHEEKLDSKFYVFAVELLSDIEENASEEIRTLRLQVKQAQVQNHTYCQVIAKYANVDAKEVDDKLVQLLAAETSFISPAHNNNPLTPIVESGDELVLTPVARGSTTFIYSLTKYPADFLSSWSNLLDIYERDKIFGLLLADWALWSYSRIGTVDYYNSFRDISKKLQYFEALDFKALVHWTSGNLEISSKIKFLRNLVQAYLHWGPQSPAFKTRSQAVNVAHWKGIAELLLGKQVYVPRIVSPWPALEYPEIMLRLFGEACLETLLPLQVPTENYIHSQPSPSKGRQEIATRISHSALGQAILHDFQAWEIPIGFHFVDATPNSGADLAILEQLPFPRL